ncbi:unnamed protein product [Staurois parvus]|uniref:Uncharacterized protein n=1 Tax=Staurois parvus TaxID=386267 RepID=A0ABN9D1P9_9NEOB|nr:unnamed protein product [Staurois parvus]
MSAVAVQILPTLQYMEESINVDLGLPLSSNKIGATYSNGKEEESRFDPDLNFGNGNKPLLLMTTALFTILFKLLLTLTIIKDAGSRILRSSSAALSLNFLLHISS